MATTQLTYTPTLGTLTKWTFSGWFKKSGITGYQQMIAVPSGSAFTVIKFETGGEISWENYDSGGGAAGVLKTNRLFRDPSAWYHVVCVWDSANATPGDRMKMYINGVEETSFANDVNPDSSETSTMCANVVHYIGANNGSDYFNGCMSWVQLVDNAALAPTEFGSVDATSGIWKISPGAYATPGTAGFCLAMEDRTNLDLDTSSNAYTFTTSGTLTATYDNPSNNFATMNPLENYYPAATFSNGNNTVATVASKYAPTLSTLGMSAGKWYWETKAAARGAGNDYLVGVSSTQTTDSNDELGKYANDWSYYSYNANYRNNNTNTSYGDTYDTGDIVGIALDLDNNKLYFSKNGTWQESGDPTSGATGTGAISITAVASTPLGAYFAGATYWTSNTATFNMNFGNGYFGTTAVSSANADDAGIGAMEYDVPTGYYCLCTKNIKAYGG